MAFDLNSISNTCTPRAPRMVLLGTEKIGKTTFACGSRFENGVLLEVGLNHPIVISAKGEEGADDLPVPKFPTCNTYNDVISALYTLYNETHPYLTVVIDSFSALEPLVWDAVCEANKVESIEKVGDGYGKGYLEAQTLFRKILEWLDALRDKGIASIIIGHVKVKKFNDPLCESYDKYHFDINEKTANMVKRWSDLIMFCNSETVVVKKEDIGFGKKKSRGVEIPGDNRYLFTKKSAAHPGGGRGIYGQLPEKLALDYSVFIKSVETLMGK